MIQARAAVLRAADAPFQLEDVVLDGPGNGEVVVRIAGVGLCHSDLMPRTPFAKPPVICGHEGAGVVEQLGPGVDSLAVGDHVVLSFDSCGSCVNCVAARPAYCDTFWPRNLTGYRVDRTTNARDADGVPLGGRWFGQSSFATHAVVAARNAVRVDPGLPIELLGPLSCGVLTGAGAVLNALDVRAGEGIVVFGAGAVGLSAVMAARAAGATKIVAVDVNPKRLELATELGATDTVDSTTDLRAQLKRHSGVPYSLDTTGVPDVLSAALGVLRGGGVLGVLGTPRGDWTLTPRDLSTGRSIRGILMGDATPRQFIPVLIDLWQQGLLPFDRLITTFPLERINDAERAMLDGDVVKPVLLPHAEESR